MNSHCPRFVLTCFVYLLRCFKSNAPIRISIRRNKFGEIVSYLHSRLYSSSQYNVVSVTCEMQISSSLQIHRTFLSVAVASQFFDQPQKLAGLVRRRPPRPTCKARDHHESAVLCFEFSVLELSLYRVVRHIRRRPGHNCAGEPNWIGSNRGKFDEEQRE